MDYGVYGIWIRKSRRNGLLGNRKILVDTYKETFHDLQLSLWEKYEATKNEISDRFQDGIVNSANMSAAGGPSAVGLASYFAYDAFEHAAVYTIINRAKYMFMTVVNAVDANITGVNAMHSNSVSNTATSNGCSN